MDHVTLAADTARESFHMYVWLCACFTAWWYAGKIRGHIKSSWMDVPALSSSAILQLYLVCYGEPHPPWGLPVQDRFSGLLKGTQAPKTEEREKFARILKETHWPLSPSTSERTQGVACCLVPGGGQGPEAGLLHLFLLLVCDCSCLCWFLDHLYKNSKTSENGKFFCFSGASKLHSDLLPRHLGAL